ncbi:MAG TPA: ABC transporter ATP-binding protein [Sphingomonadales bacterium]
MSGNAGNSGGIVVENLSVELGGRRVLDSLGFHAPAGMVTGLIGPNGAGKTTVLRALLGLVPRRSGRVSLDGRALDGLDPRERARALAYLPQGCPVHWPLTVERLVSLGRLPHQDPWRRPRPEDAAAIEAAMRATDMLHLRDRPATELSGGERMRALLARALAGEAPVLLADEPVAALDPRHALSTMELFADLAARGRTIVLVLHDLGLAARFCGRLLLMDRGRMAAAGAPRSVLAPDLLAAVYGVRPRGDLTQSGFDAA